MSKPLQVPQGFECTSESRVCTHHGPFVPSDSSWVLLCVAFEFCGDDFCLISGTKGHQLLSSITLDLLHFIAAPPSDMPEDLSSVCSLSPCCQFLFQSLPTGDIEVSQIRIVERDQQQQSVTSIQAKTVTILYGETFLTLTIWTGWGVQTTLPSRSREEWLN